MNTENLITRGATRTVLFMLATVLTVQVAQGQNAPARDGLRFNRLGVKTADALAPKAGGLTERIEIQSTEDHIDYVVKTYVLNEANAAELYHLIVNAVALEGGFVDRISAGSSCMVQAASVEGEEDVVITDYTGKSFLVVTAPEWMIPYIDQTIETLDIPGLESAAFGTGYAYFYPRHRRPSELAALISDSVASGIEVFVADDSRNLLYLEDTPSYVGGVLEALRRFDRPPDQLEVHVRIYEIDDTRGRDLGLDWNAWKKGIKDGDLTLAYDNSRTPGSYDLDLTSITGELSFSPQLATEFLNYLVERGDAEVITDTRISAVNGETATVASITQIPFVIRGGSLANHPADSPVRDSPEALDVDGLIKVFVEGVTVSFTPTIGTETIELKIEATVSSHIGYTPNQMVPLIASSSTSSVLRVVSGRPAILSGLTRTTRVSERTGIPGLNKVPILKYLFSREITRDHKRQVVISLVPNRIEPGEEPGPALAEIPASDRLPEGKIAPSAEGDYDRFKPVLERIDSEDIYIPRREMP